MNIQDLELGWYYCLIENKHAVTKNSEKHIFVREYKIKALRLEKSNLNGSKYFSVPAGHDKVIDCEKIIQSPTFKTIKTQYFNVINTEEALEFDKSYQELIKICKT